MRYVCITGRWTMSKRAGAAVLAALLLTAAQTSAADSPDSGVERREVGNLVIEGIPEVPDQVKARLLQYQNTRYASLYGWLGDDSGLVMGSRFGETNQIHYLTQPNGARHQLTFFAEPVRYAAASPAPGRRELVYARDVGGSEYYQLFHFDLATGRHALLTDGASRNGSPVWSRGGDRLAFYSTARNGRDWDLYVTRPGREWPAELALEVEGAWYPMEWSPDDRRLLVGRYVSISESYLYVLDPDTGELVQVNPTPEPVSYRSAAWSADGRGLYLASDEGAEFRTLRYYDLAEGEQRELSADIPWDAGGVDVSPQGTVAFTTNEDGRSRLYLLRDGVRRAVADLPLGVIGGMDFDGAGERLAVEIETPTSPRDLYSLEVGTGELTRWTWSEVGGLDADSFVTPALVHYPTFDEVKGAPRQIACYYWKPREGEGPFPVVIRIHGGPESQYKPYFSWLNQYLANEMGAAVLAPNVRGSSGYGKTYVKLDNGYRREDSVRDIGALLDWVSEQPELDAGRVAVRGGSYGGYMVLAAMTHYSDRLRCGISSVGISNFVTFLTNTKEYRRDLRRAEYGDERDPEMRAFLESISPTNNAHRITRPMFVIQGLNDPRVPATEAEQMLTAMRGSGAEVWYLLARDEGHGFAKKANRDYQTSAEALFLERHLSR